MRTLFISEECRHLEPIGVIEDTLSTSSLEFSLKKCLKEHFNCTVLHVPTEHIINWNYPHKTKEFGILVRYCGVDTVLKIFITKTRLYLDKS